MARDEHVEEPGVRQAEDGTNRVPAAPGPVRPAAPQGVPAGTPSGAVASNPGPSGGRALGIGAAAGLGAAATAGLLAGGHGHHGGTTGHAPAGHHGAGPAAPPAASGGDQGFTPVAATGSPAPSTAHASTAPQTAPTADTTTSSPVRPSTGHAPPPSAQPNPHGVAGQHAGLPASVLGHHGQPVPYVDLGGKATPARMYPAAGHGLNDPPSWDGFGAVEQDPGGTGSPAARGWHSSSPAGTDPSHPGAGPAPAGGPIQYPGPAHGDGSAHIPPAGTILYDSAAHPVMTADRSGNWYPVSSTHGTGSPTATPASPVLYDSAGHPVAMLDASGHVVPIRPANPPQVPLNSSETQPNSGGQPQYVPMNDSEIADYMRGLTPDQRAAQIQKVLDDNKIELSNGKLPVLPDGFWDKDSYTYTWKDANKVEHKERLNVLAAAATVAMLEDTFSHFKVQVSALSDTADKLEAKGDDIALPAMALGMPFVGVDPMWDTLLTDVGNGSDQSIITVKSSFYELKSRLFGGAITDPASHKGGSTKGNIPTVAAAIRDQATSLRVAASQYIAEEETNLSQFGLHADDPRPDWEKARFVAGKDLAKSGKYPPGYFDPHDPTSPFYRHP